MFPLILSFIGDTVKDGILGVFLLIDSVIYWAVSKLYGLFIDIASARIFSSEVISDVGNRLYGLIGVIMLFVVAYSLLTAIIDPNKMSKGEMSSGKLAKNTIISIIIIAVLPTVFNFMYKVQDVIMTENVFGKIIFGDPDDGKVDSVTITVDLSQISEEERNDAINMFKMEEDPSTGYYTYTQPATSLQAKKYGNKMAFGVLHAFLNPDDVDVKVKATKSGTAEKVHTVSKGAAVVTCAAGAVGAVSLAIISALPAFTTLPAGLTAASIIMGVSCNGAIQAAAASKAVIYVSGQETKWSELSKHVEESGDFMELARLSKPIVDGEIDYMPVASTICGAVLLYVILSFCLDLGVRAVKLAFYQLIAPLPIMLRIVPKQEKMFNNWLKCTLSTYFEVFVRLTVIYIITYLASKIFASDTFVFEQLGMFGKAIVVMGLVAFAKQAPKLIGEVTGIKSDGLKLGIRDKLAAGGALTAGAVIGGGLVAGLRNGVNAYKGAEGGKGKKIAAAFRSGLAGAGSGAIRSGYGARNAKTFADVKKSINDGATAANKKAAKRANFKKNHAQGYKAAYDSSKATTRRGKIVDALKGGVIGGHIYNAGESVAQYFGLINNIDSARAETQIAADFTKAAKSISSTADDYIGKHLDQFYDKSEYGVEAAKLVEKMSLAKQKKKSFEAILTNADSTAEQKAEATAEIAKLSTEISDTEKALTDTKYVQHRLDVLKVAAETPAQTEELQKRVQQLNLDLTSGDAVSRERVRINDELKRIQDELVSLGTDITSEDVVRRRSELLASKDSYTEKLKTVEEDVTSSINEEISNINKAIIDENVRVSQAAKDYNLAMKNSRDNFANTVQYLEGAEAEKRDVNASYEIINDLLKTNKTSATVAAIYGGSEELGVKGLDDLPADDIALRVKAVSKMSEDSASRASALVAEYERRERDKKEGK